MPGGSGDLIRAQGRGGEVGSVESPGRVAEWPLWVISVPLGGARKVVGALESGARVVTGDHVAGRWWRWRGRDGGLDGWRSGDREGEHVLEAHEIATLVVPPSVVLAVPRKREAGEGGGRRLAVMFRAAVHGAGPVCGGRRVRARPRRRRSRRGPPVPCPCPRGPRPSPCRAGPRRRAAWPRGGAWPSCRLAGCEADAGQPGLGGCEAVAGLPSCCRAAWFFWTAWAWLLG